MEDVNEAMTVPQKEQNAGVALLLERMKTNPEEFTEHGKWGSLIHSHKMFLSEEDCKALDAGINALMQQHFTEKVLEELVDPTEKSNVKKLGNMFTKNLRAAALGQTPIAGVTVKAEGGAVEYK
jgi:hypothetical protein